MPTQLKDYADKYETIRFRREDGILEMTLHSNGDSLRWGPAAHSNLEEAFNDVGRDPENQIVILTGIGAEFSGPEVTPSTDRAVPKLTPEQWGKLGSEARRFTMNMLNIEVPMIGVVNGPALRHPELPLLCDIVIGSDDCSFQDSAHFRGGMVPGDGVNVVFTLLMGMNRGRYFLYTAQTIGAKQALEMGLVNELHAKDEVLARGWEHARNLMKQSALNRKYTRWLLTEPLRRQMNELLGYGLAMEGLVICN
ncbi:MAG: enoyl-CoA hydratase/isomerase family protein [Betaproteobacteria bacterium]|nr:enoyl-CoA hydratase/isomerase family protein [Betaproteobacteria bacterium]